MALLPFAAAECCCLRLKTAKAAGTLFVTARMGPLRADGAISHVGSIKVFGEWDSVDEMCWIIQDVPLQAMAARSPTGMVACRFKLWTQGSISRRWLGRMAPMAVPSPSIAEQLGDFHLMVEIQRGTVLRTVDADSARVFNTEGCETPPSVDRLSSPEPLAPGARTLGAEILRVASLRQWGLATALLQELQMAQRASQKQAMSIVDSTRRSALRLFVDGQHADRARLRQALESSILTVLLSSGRRPYWCKITIASVNHRSSCWLGEQKIGMPRSRGFSISSPWSSPAGIPFLEDCQWGEPKDVQGDVDISTAMAGTDIGRLQMGEGTDLILDLAPPGAPVAFGAGVFPNPLSMPMLVARGKIDGIPACGVFDHRVSARLAAESETSGPREAAALAFACGADPRALADDGLSPFTAALLGEDPCNLLAGVSRQLRGRILRNDAFAWAELSRSSIGASHADMAAAPLMRQLAVPEELAQNLFEHCIRENLPLVAARALDRVGGQRHLSAALERANNPQWRRVAERILTQMREDDTFVFSREMLEHTVSQIRQGRVQFRLLLRELVGKLRREYDFYAHPGVLDPRGGAECSICFEPLCKTKPVAFADAQGHAVCPHFLHPTCAQNMASSAPVAGNSVHRCPECRRAAPKVKPMPDIAKDPLAWFDFLASPSGSLSRSTLQRAVSAMLPVDPEKFAAALDEGLLTPSPVGHEISAVDFLAGGLFAWVWRHDEEHRQLGKLGDPPDLSDKQRWFQYWNYSNSGYLSRGEVLRAVLRAFRASSLDTARVAELRRRVDGVWASHLRELQRQGQGSSGASDDDVSLADFVAPNGLGEVLEEAFGMELSDGSPHRREPDALQPTGYAKLGRGRRRQEQVAERARAIRMALVRRSAMQQQLRAPSLAAHHGAVGGVLDLLAGDSAAEGRSPSPGRAIPSLVPLPQMPGVAGESGGGTARGASGSPGPRPPQDEDPRAAREDITALDALAALEVLERDLQSSLNDTRQDVISI